MRHEGRCSFRAQVNNTRRCNPQQRHTRICIKEEDQQQQQRFALPAPRSCRFTAVASSGTKRKAPAAAKEPAAKRARRSAARDSNTGDSDASSIGNGGDSSVDSGGVLEQLLPEPPATPAPPVLPTLPASPVTAKAAKAALGSVSSAGNQPARLAPVATDRAPPADFALAPVATAAGEGSTAFEARPRRAGAGKDPYKLLYELERQRLMRERRINRQEQEDEWARTNERVALS